MADSPDTMTIADRALLAAQRGWAGEADDRFWACFAAPWRETLRAGWQGAARLDREESRQALRREHEAQSRPDLSRVHPSWWLRALKDESPAVQRAVLASAPRWIREALEKDLGLAAEELRNDREPHPEALRAAAGLWTERLVGDLPEREDPPVIVALTRTDRNEVSRLIPLIGLARWAASGLDISELKERDQDAWSQFRASLSGRDPAFTAQARRDVARYGQVPRHAEVSLGLLTFARLLDGAEPYRVRWALQHLPYNLAKSLRTMMRPSERPGPALLPWESELLAAASARLRDERVSTPERGGES